MAGHAASVFRARPQGARRGSGGSGAARTSMPLAAVVSSARDAGARSCRLREGSMKTFAEARRFLLDRREDYDGAVAGFRWPEGGGIQLGLRPFRRPSWPPTPNTATARRSASSTSPPAVTTRSRSSRCRGDRIASANLLASLGVRRGDRLVLLVGGIAPLWETILAAMKLGAVVIPATDPSHADRVDRPARPRPRPSRRCGARPGHEVRRGVRPGRAACRDVGRARARLGEPRSGGIVPGDFRAGRAG